MPSIGVKLTFGNFFSFIFSIKLLKILIPSISLDFELSHLTAFLCFKDILDNTLPDGSSNCASALANSVAPSTELSLQLATFSTLMFLLLLLRITVIGPPFS